MICPCKNCERKGCGQNHDTCEQYAAWVKHREEVRSRRSAESELNGYKIRVAEKIRGKKK